MFIANFAMLWFVMKKEQTFCFISCNFCSLLVAYNTLATVSYQSFYVVALLGRTTFYTQGVLVNLDFTLGENESYKNSMDHLNSNEHSGCLNRFVNNRYT